MTVEPLLDFIADHESEGAARRWKISAYDVVWAGIRKEYRPKKPLTTMTIGEVLAWQDSIDPMHRSEAAGRYQILEDTLRHLYAEAGLTLKSLFDKAGQDALAIALLKRRGLDKYLSGKLTVGQFCNELAKEWASLPVVSGKGKGRSYYHGDGLNSALVDVAPFLAAVAAIKPKPPPIPKSQLIIGPDVAPPPTLPIALPALPDQAPLQVAEPTSPAGKSWQAALLELLSTLMKGSKK
jgi:muramidase (phage lysozyme)